MENILSVDGLHVSFKVEGGRLYALRGVSFQLHRGEALAIVGESGSGKSVTSRAIMGILAPGARVDSGSIMYGGRDILKLKERELCRLRGNKIAMVFQDPMSSLNPIMKIGKQIEESIILGAGKNKKISGDELKKKCLELMGEVGIQEAEKRYNMYPFEFSGGMRQRIVIAMALAASPEILICDEPTTALDVTVQAQILELFVRLKKERKLSLIFITHDLGVVAGIADRVAVMYAGKVVEWGNVEDIFYDPQHPYTWALLSAMPDLETKGRLAPIPGAPPDLTSPPAGDAFAFRNKDAMKIDFIKEPPIFKISETHYAATWRLHPKAPKTYPPEELSERINRMLKERNNG